MKNLLIFCIIIVIVGMLTGMGFGKDRYMSEEGVKIVIYKEGKEIPIDPNTAHFKELQEKCEGFLSSANDVVIDYITKGEVIETKKEKLSIEIIYAEPKEIEIPLLNKKEKADHLLILLTNKYMNRKTKIGAAIFFYGPNYGVEHSGPYLASKDVAEITSLLKSMGFDID